MSDNEQYEKTTKISDISAENYEQLMMEAINGAGLTRISIQFLELFTTLIHLNYGEVFSTVYDVPIPPSYTFTITINVPLNKVIIASEFSDVVDRDGVLDLIIINDNTVIHTDPAMISALYQPPINFFKIGALLPTKNKVTIDITNNDTANTVNLYHWVKYGQFDKDLYNAIIARFFQVIRQEASRITGGTTE